ncbi:MAG TPA: YkgJ family cysteine cluster protein [Acidimicrobiales bacterium]|nr:YkgJ family cysteine cluster protein [Acidimicrobiales bacterium]
MGRPTDDGEVTQDNALAAGAFSTWLVGMQRALRGEAGSDVPCDGCTACCTSSQFVHIAPDETETLAHIPAELQFPAPRLPRGNVLLGYDEDGRCPMLVDGACSIYEHRPKTCRTYDCRVFPASGVEVDDADQPAIARRVRRWHFDHPTEADRVEHEAVRAAARFVRERGDVLPDGTVPANATQHAVLAVLLHHRFLGHDDTGRPAVVEPEPEAVRVALSPRDRSRRRAG